MKLPALDYQRSPTSGLYLPSGPRVRRRRGEIIDARYLFHRRRALRTAPAGTSWATWGETDESGWGDSGNTFICLFENPVANGHETGQGGPLSGADLTVSQVGNIAGASGSPPKRLVDGTGGDYFQVGDVTSTTFFEGTTFTYIAKLNAMSAKGGILELYDGTTHLLLDTDGRFYTAGFTTNSDVSWATDPATPTGDIYFALFDDGLTTYWGWSATRPTKLSDFPAAQRVSKASINGTWAGPLTRRGILGSSDTSITMVAYAYYVIFSLACLIDTAS